MLSTRWLTMTLLTSLLSLTACSGQKLLNALSSERGTKITRDVVYEAASGLKADIYAPKDASGAPVIVFFYGGRWSEGDKSGYEFVGAALAKQGFVTVVPNYRLYPQVKYRGFLEDSAKAVRWAREHGAEFGGDAQKLFVMGHSAGAYNAAMIATDPAWLAAVGGSRDWLSGMIGLAGPYDFLPFEEDDLRDMFGPPPNWPNSQPINHVDGKNPPMLLLHGENDKGVYPKNSRNFAAKIRAAGGPVELHLFPKLSHIWIVATLSTTLQSQSQVMPLTRDFVLRPSQRMPAGTK